MAENENPGLAAPDDVPVDASGPAVAIALTLGKATRGAKLPPEAAEFLKKQSRMLDLQMEHLHEERTLHHRHLALRFFGDRLRVGLQLLAIAFGLIVVVGLGAMVWAAHEAHGIVIEAFSVPPDLAQRGLTGQVAASELLDRLAQMQADTVSARPASTYANDWGGDIKVEIPETGVSVGDLDRYLRGWLGHETHIGGEVVRTAAGLAVTARVGATPGASIQGADANVDKLVQQAAEAVYAQTQPYRYAVFLATHGRQNEALAAYAKLATAGPVEERPWAYAGWGNLLGNLGDDQGLEQKAREAIRLGPNLPAGYLVLLSWEGPRSHWQTSLDIANLAVQRLEPQDRTAFADVFNDILVGDYRACVTRLSNPRAIDSEGVLLQIAGLKSQCLALDHNVTAARQAVVVLADAPFTDPKPAIDLAVEDWSAMARDAEADDLIARSSPAIAPAMQRMVGPYQPLAYAELGRRAEADALIAATPLDCDLCVETRARIATLEGDGRAADRWYSALVRQTPGVPLGFNDWGESHLARGDPDAAIAQFKLAHDKGPNWADPLEGWGEALMKKGDFAGAIGKFEAAAKDAPRWGRLHLMWGQSLARLGRADQARDQWRQAGGMDLSRDDRAALAKLL